MNKNERKKLFFSFFDQLLPDHAEAAKAAYDGEEYEEEEIDTHADALFYGAKNFSGLLGIYRQLEDGTYNLQLTPQVCKDKAKEHLYGERMATDEDMQKMEDKIEGFGNDNPIPTVCTKEALPSDAAERKTYPIYSGFITYFPHAIAAVSHLSYLGNQQHHPDKPLHWDKEKSSDERDAMMRHVIDGDWEQVAWRALANLERKLTNTCNYERNHQ
jgi:hypothetical protein